MKTELTQHCVDNVGDVGGGVVGQQQRVVGGELQQHAHQHYHQAIRCQHWETLPPVLALVEIATSLREVFTDSTFFRSIVSSL